MKKNSAELIYENTVPGIFVKRNNRFTAQVLIGGTEETVHVKNTGRLTELLVPRAKVTLQKVDKPERVTAYDLISVYKARLNWVNIDSFAPNVLTKRWLQNIGYDVIKPEYKIGNSRLDFYMEMNGQKYLTEVKGCTLADTAHAGVGLFPDAPTARGVKHLRELIKAEKEGFGTAVTFVIQMNTVHLVAPNFKTDPEFGKALLEAEKAGVRIRSLSCHVEADRIRVIEAVEHSVYYNQVTCRL